MNFTFIVSTLEAIATNILVSGQYIVVTSFENYFGEEMLVLKTIC